MNQPAPTPPSPATVCSGSAVGPTSLSGVDRPPNLPPTSIFPMTSEPSVLGPLTGVVRAFSGDGPVDVRFTGFVSGTVIAELGGKWSAISWKSNPITSSTRASLSPDGRASFMADAEMLILRCFERNGGPFQAGFAALKAQDAELAQQVAMSGTIGIRNQQVIISNYEVCYDL